MLIIISLVNNYLFLQFSSNLTLTHSLYINQLASKLNQLWGLDLHLGLSLALVI